jgi:hypothetical protein
MTRETKLTEGQRAYEAKRAAKAGVSLEKWLTQKEREQAQAAPAAAPKPPKKPNLLSRLIDRGHQPLKKDTNPMRRK